MCGIVGIINLDDKPICLEELKRFRDSIRHRGPDDEGVFIRHNVGFGHRRLSIIDLSNKGKQPMIYNDRYVITYNGECYNFEEVRYELKKKGFKLEKKKNFSSIYLCFNFVLVKWQICKFCWQSQRLYFK